MFDLLIKNGTLITVDPDHRVYQPGFVAVSGNSIAAIGPMSDLPADASAARTIDASGHAVLPGLIDSHGHAGHCLTKTLGEHLGDEWEPMAEGIYHRFSDEEFWRSEGALAALERLKFGVTTGVSMLGNTPRVDRLELLDAHFAGALPIGIRQVSGIGSPNPPWPKLARVWSGDDYREYAVNPEDAFPQTEQAIRQWQGKHPRAYCYVMPSRIGRAPSIPLELAIKQNREMRRIANSYGVPIHAHAFGGDMEFVQQTSPEVLGGDISLSHSTGMSPHEWQIMAEKGISVCHGPSTHSVMRQRCPAFEMLEAGVNVVIATDGTAPDRSFDLWRDLRVAQVLHRGHFHHTGLLPAGLVLEMATIRAARALKLDHLIGSLEVGKRADIILVDVEQPHLAPFGVMPIQRLVYHASGQDVSHVIVDGQVLMQDRQVQSVDQRCVLSDARAAFLQMMRSSGNWDKTENPNLYALRSF